jgi:outer membrane protein insertion porin family
MGRLELQVPVSSSLQGLGIRPSAFIDVGSLWGLKKPLLTDIVAVCTPKAGTTGLSTFQSPTANCSLDYGGAAHDPTKFTGTPGFKEVFLGNSPSPRLSIGIGANWNSPFGPLRLDLAKALLKQKGDDTKLFNFNVGTQF